MRWTLLAHETNALRSDGKGVWSWRPDAGVKFAEMIRERRWLQSPVHGGRARHKP